ncbi:MAG: DUF4215 domain-containing protein [Deltaproteobacteria bacterium]|nr:DUF4215 domain-containing protein [Deltaproteobacteria bacterium]
MATNLAGSDNSGNGRGGGLYRSGGTVTLNSSLLALNNTNGTRTAWPEDCFGSFTSTGHNVVESPYTNCTFTEGVEDLLGPSLGSAFNSQISDLTDTVGPTPVFLIVAGNSPAFGYGDPATCPTTDQRGVSRAGGRCDTGAYQAPVCGDGTRDASEVCDDGNLRNADGCDSNCTVTACGNGLRTLGERCDDGNQDNTDACTNVCRDARCGDGFIRSDVENCDDSNAITEVCAYGQQSCTVCTSNCSSQPGAITGFCSNGIREAEEGCDDGNSNDADACRNSCVSATCGDGLVQTDVEQCDEGAANSMNPNVCRLMTCLRPFCGDGIQDDGEICDDGNAVAGDGCTASCTIETPVPTIATEVIPTATEVIPTPSAKSVGGCSFIP